MTAFVTSRSVGQIVATTSVLVATAIAAANEQPPAPPTPATYDLRYKLVTGDVLRYDVKHRASFRTTIDQTTQEAQTKTDSVKLWKVSDVLPNGDIEIMNVVEHVRMVHQLPDREPVDYDSRQDKTPPPGFEDTARAIGVPLSVIRINAAGKVLRRDVKLRQKNVEEDAPIVVRLPEKPVTIGETWDDAFDVKVTLENGETKTIQTRRRHKLAGVKSGIATIEVTYQVLTPIDPFVEAQLVQRLMEGEVKFDIEAGRVVSQQMDIDKRILGFAGPTSSMHYITRMEEKLVTSKPEVARKQPAPQKAQPTPRAAQKRPVRTSRSASRSRVPQGAKGYRR